MTPIALQAMWWKIRLLRFWGECTRHRQSLLQEGTRLEHQSTILHGQRCSEGSLILGIPPVIRLRRESKQIRLLLRVRSPTSLRGGGTTIAATGRATAGLAPFRIELAQWIVRPGRNERSRSTQSIRKWAERAETCETSTRLLIVDGQHSFLTPTVCPSIMTVIAIVQSSVSAVVIMSMAATEIIGIVRSGGAFTTLTAIRDVASILNVIGIL